MSPVSALRQLADGDDAAGDGGRDVGVLAAEHRGQVADALVDIVVLVPRALGEVTGHVDDGVARRVPEKTRTIDTLPTYGSLVVLMTSAHSGPDASADSGSRGSRRSA